LLRCDATFVKGLEQEYKSNLEVNLEESAKDLTIITPFMKNEWKGFEQVSDAQMLQKYDTSFPKAALDSIIKTVSTLPSDKKFINKISKIVTDRKTGYDNNNRLGTAETQRTVLLTEGLIRSNFWSGDVELSHRHAVVKVEDSEEEVIECDRK
jgi:2-oxoglutarate dehydrogenase E1 component